MWRLPGAQLYLSSGMASAALTNSLSIVLISRSTVAAIVGAAWGVGAGLAAGAAGLAWPQAMTAKLAINSRQNVLMGFIFSFSSLNDYESTMAARCKRYHGASSNPAASATAAAVTAKRTSVRDATVPHTALPRAKPP